MSAELPLSMRILLVLNPSIIAYDQGVVMWLLHSFGVFFEKNMFLSVRLYFKGGVIWMLFTCL